MSEDKTNTYQDLRRRAESEIGRRPDHCAPVAPEDTRKLIH